MARGDVISAGYISIEDPFPEDVIIFEEGASDEIVAEPPDVILTPEQRNFYYGTRSPFTLERVLPSTGPLSMSQIKAEVGASGQVSLNDADFRALISRDAGKQQSISEYRGQSAEPPAFSEDGAATGSYNYCGSGTGYSSHSADASRACSVGVTSPDNGTISAETWIMIPWGSSKPASGQAVKFDYNMSARWTNPSYGNVNWAIGSTLTSPDRFVNTPVGANRQYTFSQTLTFVSGSSSGGHQWHEDGGLKFSGSKFNSKTFNYSTYFNWGTPGNFLSFKVYGSVRGTNRNNQAMISSIAYKITEM